MPFTTDTNNKADNTVTAMFFKPGGKWYDNREIIVPKDTATKARELEARIQQALADDDRELAGNIAQEQAHLYFEIRNYIYENRNKFGYEEMHMVCTGEGADDALIGYPLMIPAE